VFEIHVSSGLPGPYLMPHSVAESDRSGQTLPDAALARYLSDNSPNLLGDVRRIRRAMRRVQCDQTPTQFHWPVWARQKISKEHLAVFEPDMARVSGTCLSSTLKSIPQHLGLRAAVHLDRQRLSLSTDRTGDVR